MDFSTFGSDPFFLGVLSSEEYIPSWGVNGNGEIICFYSRTKLPAIKIRVSREHLGLQHRWLINTFLLRTSNHLFVSCCGRVTFTSYRGKDFAFSLPTLPLEPAQGPITNKHSGAVDELER